MEDTISRQEFVAETDKLRDRIEKHDRQISVLETLVENLRGLPSAINSLEKTIALMGQNIESLNKKVDVIVASHGNENRDRDAELEKKIEELDNKSKVDILDFVRLNWWKIVVAVASIYVLLDKVNLPF